VQILPIERQKPPQSVGAYAINEAGGVVAAVVNSRSPIIRKLDCKVPFGFFDHCNRSL